MRRLPDDAELRFIRTVATGTVHLIITPRERATDTTPAVSIATGLTAWASGARPVITRCGAHTQPVITTRWEYVSEFDDDDLCRACYRTLAPADQHRAFEHAQAAA
ncbi:hypothetical protein [Kitasatospora cineracea]|uniref:hypothetical protein n=1 Tax=Kitasatospora cineracea TaxID=88074 RepID=UPI00367DDE7A